MEKLRNSNIEILRFFLMAFICFWHVIVHGYDFKSVGCEEYEINANMGMLTFFCTLFSPAVYCFVFISGWYGIKFSLKKYFYFAFLGIACYILSLIVIYIWDEKLSVHRIITHIFPIASCNWWFLTNYVMVYLIAPFIECGLRTIDKSVVKQIIYIMTFIEVGSFLMFVPSFGSSFYGLLYIYVLARYISINSNSICFSTNWLITIYIICFMLLWGMCYWATALPGMYAKLSFFILGYNNPFIIVMSVSIFFLFLKLKPYYSRYINQLLSNVFSVYLLTEGIGDSLYKYEAFLFNNNSLYGILFVIFSMFLCLLFGKIVSICFVPIYKLISNTNHFQSLFRC